MVGKHNREPILLHYSVKVGTFNETQHTAIWRICWFLMLPTGRTMYLWFKTKGFIFPVSASKKMRFLFWTICSDESFFCQSTVRLMGPLCDKHTAGKGYRNPHVQIITYTKKADRHMLIQLQSECSVQVLPVQDRKYLLDSMQPHPEPYLTIFGPAPYLNKTGQTEYKRLHEAACYLLINPWNIAEKHSKTNLSLALEMDYFPTVIFCAFDKEIIPLMKSD